MFHLYRVMEQRYQGGNATAQIIADLMFKHEWVPYLFGVALEIHFCMTTDCVTVVMAIVNITEEFQKHYTT